MRYFFTALPLVVALTATSQLCEAQDDERFAQMQQTIQELTLQLGDALRENGALRKQVQAANAGQPVTDCPPVAAHVPSQIMPRDGSAPRPMVTESPQRDEMVMSAPRTERPAGCDVDGLIRQVDARTDASAKEMTINGWLGDHAGNCSRDQLMQLRDFSRTLSLGDDAQSLIDYYLDQ